MKHLSLLVTSVLLLLFATGCGVSSYMTQNQNQNQTNVVLSDSNYKVVKTVEATVTNSYVFGIGGLSKKALMSNAVSELTKKANLTGSQALVNVTVQVQNKIILVWNRKTRKTVVAHGTVVEFIDK